MNDRLRDLLRQKILSLINSGVTQWKRVEKLACPVCWEWATTNTVRRQFYGYLVPEGYVKRVGRGRYALTERGRMLLHVLSMSNEQAEGDSS